jgi:tRNA(Ile)-lysidine synthase
VGQLGAAPDFQATEALRTLALTGRAGQKCQLAQGLKAERTPRELRLAVGQPAADRTVGSKVPSEYSAAIPGEIEAPSFGLRLRIEFSGRAAAAEGPAASGQVATLRNWRPGDRVRLRYSSGPRKVKEVLERLRVTGSRRTVWPVLDVSGRILWMLGVELETAQGINVVATAMGEASGSGSAEPLSSGTFDVGE